MEIIKTMAQKRQKIELHECHIEVFSNNPFRAIIVNTIYLQQKIAQENEMHTTFYLTNAKNPSHRF